MTDPLNIILDDFGMWILGYRIEFSCLYVPQGHYLISTLWLWCTDEYVNFWFWVKVYLQCFCFIPGPYYKYRTYHDMIHLGSDANIPMRKYVIARLKQIPIIAAIYLTVSNYFSLEVSIAWEHWPDTSEFITLSAEFWKRWIRLSCYCSRV